MIDSAACTAWARQPTINPITGRAITSTGAIYKQFQEICTTTAAECASFRADPDGRHPRTGRKLPRDAPEGIYAQLVHFCDSLQQALPPGTAPSKAVNSKKSTTQPPQQAKSAMKSAANHARLITALKKALRPILHRGGQSLKARVAFAKILRRYLSDLEPCVQSVQRRMPAATHTPPPKLLGLVRKGTKDPVVFFDTRLGGSDATQSVAYMTAGQGLGRLFKFSSKIIASMNAIEEIKLLKKMSDLAEGGLCPNMPILYNTLMCPQPCRVPKCPSFMRATSDYFVALSELADTNLLHWFADLHTQAEYESVIIQILLSVYAFHNLGYQHNDCHLGNFLLHRISPIGYWRYRIDDVDLYVPNHGWLLVLWDPGLAELSDRERTADYLRPLTLISNMAKLANRRLKYRALGLKAIAPQMASAIGLPHLLQTIQTRSADPAVAADKTDRLLMRAVLDGISQESFLPSIVLGAGRKVPPGILLNVRPYTMVLKKEK